MMPFTFGFSAPYHARPMGYAHLVQTHAFDVVSHTCWSFLADAGGKKESFQNQIQINVYPPSYGWEDWESDLQHILFSLKYDGLSIEPTFRRGHSKREHFRTSRLKHGLPSREMPNPCRKSGYSRSPPSA